MKKRRNKGNKLWHEITWNERETLKSSAPFKMKWAMRAGYYHLFLICFKCRLFARYLRVLNANQTIRKNDEEKSETGEKTFCHWKEKRTNERQNQPKWHFSYWFLFVFIRSLERFRHKPLQMQQFHQQNLKTGDAFQWVELYEFHWTFMLSYWTVNIRYRSYDFIETSQWKENICKRILRALRWIVDFISFFLFLLF